MKKTAIFMLCLIMAGVQCFSAFAGAQTANFSHPEVGEFMTVVFDRQSAYFEIYGFTYYSIMDMEKPYRDIAVKAPGKASGDNPSFDEVTNLVLDTAEGKEGYPHLNSFSFYGAAKEYDEALAALSRQDKVKALRILNGFDGAEGFDALPGIPGFENAPVDELKAGYADYYVVIDGVRYPYRTQGFFFEEDDWYEYYNEKYSFVQVEGDWRLIRITKEYSDEYKQRSPYVHGVSGSMPEMIAKTNEEALRNTVFGMDGDEAAKALGASAANDRIELKDQKLYRLPCRAEFVLDAEHKLDSVQYVFDSVQAFYSAFVSLYIRYFDPVVLDEEGNMQWFQNDMRISLEYDDNAPTLTFSRLK